MFTTNFYCNLSPSANYQGKVYYSEWGDGLIGFDSLCRWWNLIFTLWSAGADSLIDTKSGPPVFLITSKYLAYQTSKTTQRLLVTSDLVIKSKHRFDLSVILKRCLIWWSNGWNHPTLRILIWFFYVLSHHPSYIFFFLNVTNAYTYLTCLFTLTTATTKKHLIKHCQVSWARFDDPSPILLKFDPIEMFLNPTTCTYHKKTKDENATTTFALLQSAHFNKMREPLSTGHWKILMEKLSSTAPGELDLTLLKWRTEVIADKIGTKLKWFQMDHTSYCYCFWN